MCLLQEIQTASRITHSLIRFLSGWLCVCFVGAGALSLLGKQGIPPLDVSSDIEFPVAGVGVVPKGDVWECLHKGDSFQTQANLHDSEVNAHRAYNPSSNALLRTVTFQVNSQP